MSLNNITSILFKSACAFAGLALFGCVSVHGPSAKVVQESPQVEVVYVNSYDDIPGAYSNFFTIEQPASNPSRRYREQLAVRDTITILITDTDTESPFFRPGTAYQVGPIEIPSSGYIKIPYIGNIYALGTTLAYLSEDITKEVKSVSSSADATVLRPNRMHFQAGVIGDVKNPGSFPISKVGFDSISLLAAAGGAIDHPHGYVYKLKRNGKSYCYNFSTISNTPFLVEDGDVISVERDPAYAYYTMGQFQKPSRLQLRGPNTSVADAMMESGGLKDGFGGSKADPKGLFVFRDKAYCGKWCTEGKSCMPGTMFTAYVLDIERADFPLLIQKFRIQERDVVYASEAPMSHVNRTVSELAPIIGLATTTAILSNNVN